MSQAGSVHSTSVIAQPRHRPLAEANRITAKRLRSELSLPRPPRKQRDPLAFINGHVRHPAGHDTSIRLSGAFWDAVDDIKRREKLPELR